MYKLLFSVVFRRMPAETAHRLGFALIRCAAAVPGCRWLLRRLLAPRDPVLRVHAFGRELPGPLGLAAGFDKDAAGFCALSNLGFAFVEVGTVTAEPQPGNPKPRLFRLPTDRALINRMGFNNHGAAAAARRLQYRPRSGRAAVVGANIGKTKVTRQSAASADYAHTARLLAPAADYLVINVSSPNTPGLRDLQAVSELRALIAAVQDASQSASRGDIPLLVKIAPDLADEDLDAVADLALELGLAGILATNTTVSRDYLSSSAAEIAAAGAGGLSGPPLRPRALHVLRRLRARVGDRLVLVAAGGIETPDDAWERIRAGATLVQGYTGFIYGGPLWPRRVHRGLARRAREAGFASVQDAVGTSALAAALTDVPGVLHRGDESSAYSAPEDAEFVAFWVREHVPANLLVGLTQHRGTRLDQRHHVLRRDVPLDADDAPVMQLARWLDDEGVRPVHGGPWSDGSLRQIIQCQTYAGRRVDAKGRVELELPVDSRLIDMDIWKQANQKIATKRTTKVVAPKPEMALLAGANCNHPDCNAGYNGRPSPLYRIMVGVGSYRRAYYRCVGAQPTRKGCGAPLMLAEELEGMVNRRMFFWAVEDWVEVTVSAGRDYARPAKQLRMLLGATLQHGTGV
jgi:dihydroorotate dehydrogenase